MKKLSISLFAVLAIVFAVSSAFTSTNKAKRFTDFHQMWGVSTSIDPTPTLPSYATIDAASKTLLEQQTGVIDFDGPGSAPNIQATDYLGQIDLAYNSQGPFDTELFSTFDGSNNDKNVLCQVNTDLSCIAYVVDFQSGTDVVRAVKTGAYSVISE